MLTKNTLGPLQTNSYIIPLQKHLLIVDPASDPFWFINIAKKSKLDASVLLTHGHGDHIGAVPKICEILPQTTVYASKGDYDFFMDSVLNMSHTMGHPTDLKKCANNIRWIKEGNLIIDNLSISILDLPGHSTGSMGFYIKDKKFLFSGDTLFNSGVGNTILPRGNYKKLISSIKNKLLTLPWDTRVLPGHGPETTIQQEKKHFSSM